MEVQSDINRTPGKSNIPMSLRHTEPTDGGGVLQCRPSSQSPVEFGRREGGKVRQFVSVRSSLTPYTGLRVKNQKHVLQMYVV